MDDTWMKRLEGVTTDEPVDRLHYPTEEINSRQEFLENPPKRFNTHTNGCDVSAALVSDEGDYLIYLLYNAAYKQAYTVYVFRRRCDVSEGLSQEMKIRRQEEVMSTAPWFGDNEFWRSNHLDWTVNAFDEFNFVPYTQL